MKRIIALSFLIVFFYSCKKCPDKDLCAVGPVPQSFYKKVLIEEFTGEWGGWCPEGTEKIRAIQNAHPDAVINIAVHDGDRMERANFNTWIKTLTKVTGYPNASIDRQEAIGRDYWANRVSSKLTTAADAGLAIETKLKGMEADIKVYIGYKMSLGRDKLLTVAIMEDEVPQTVPGAQVNYSSEVTVDPDAWKHNNVLRGFATNMQGYTVDLTSSKHYTIVDLKRINLSGMGIKDITKVRVVAFIHQNIAPRAVYNVQQCGLDETKKWD